MAKHPRAASLAVVVAAVIACGGSDGGGPGTTPRVQAPPSERAAQAWRERPGEDAALGLARAYYPEFFRDEEAANPAGASDPTALSVQLPARAGDPMELSTRGHTFRVTRLGGAPATSHRGGVSFSGPAQLWAASGPARRVGGRLLTERLEEYDIVEGGTTHRATYRVELPRGLSGITDTGHTLEFSDGAGGPPVLRMHFPQVRAANGALRQGAVTLRGVGRSPRGTGHFSAAGAFDVEVSVDVSGLPGPLVVDPGWSSTAAMSTLRTAHTATQLADGRVLVAGGSGAVPAGSAELYDPVTGAWASTGAMAVARSSHSATRLPSGKVLVAGGRVGVAAVASAELFDPAAGTWSTAAALPAAREGHTATLLASGLVLVAGGLDGAALGASALFDPAAGTWGTTGALSSARYGHTATLLPSGSVLVVGGLGASVTNASAELYDPSSGTWSTTAAMPATRGAHSATLLPSGKVLVAGGYSGLVIVASAALYDPAAGGWTSAPPMATPRAAHSATLLPSGSVLVAGGRQAVGQTSVAEVFDPGAGTWSVATGGLATARGEHSATLLPTGKVLLAGGTGASGALDSAELFDPVAGRWSGTGPVATARSSFTATLLASGLVLIAGGSSSGGYLTSCELYDPSTGLFSPTGDMGYRRYGHTATLLPSGQVLVVAGHDGVAPQLSAELFDPSTGTWAETDGLGHPRRNHTATLLPSGAVLVTGGDSSAGQRNTAELYDPSAATWGFAAPMANARSSHTATLLPSGKVLIAGGSGASVELYEPALNTWTATGPLAFARYSHSATLLPSGKVLVVGGFDGVPLGSAELYDPSVGAWTTTAALGAARFTHPATLLPSGKVLIVGGQSSGAPLAAPAVYDPGTGTWATPAAPSTPRALHAAILLPSGSVLLVSGRTGISYAYLASAELYADTGALEAWRPAVLSPGSLLPGAATVVSGARFRGLSGASGGLVNDSSTDAPRVSLQALEGGRVITLGVTGFSATTATVAVPGSVPVGRYLLWVTSNGISGGKVVRVGTNAAPVAVAQSPATLEDTSFNGALGVTDADGDPVAITIVAGPTHGTLTSTWPGLSYAPAPDYAGPDSFTFKASDGTVDSAIATVSLSVTPVNDAPRFDALPDAGILEDASGQTITLTGVGPGGGTDEGAQTVTVTATSSDPSVVPDPTASGTGATRTLSVSPVANASGTVTITVTARDSGGTASGGVDVLVRSFALTVAPVNDAPTFDALADLTVLEDAVTQAVTVTGVAPGGGGPELGQTVAVTARSSDPAIVPHPLVIGVGVSRTLSFTPAPNAAGTVTITVTAQDTGGVANGGVDTFSRSFTVSVTPVNDAPTFAPIAALRVTEDSAMQVVQLTGLGPGGGADESAQPLTLSATSDNPLIVPHPVVVGSGASLALSVTPAPNAHGGVTITVTATDGSGTANGGAETFTLTFPVTVTPVNDAPTFDPVADVTVLEDVAARDVILQGIDPGGGVFDRFQDVAVTAISSDTSLIPHPTVVGAGNLRTLSFTPAANAVGRVTITVSATDGDPSDLRTFLRSFEVTVLPVNDAPSFESLPDLQVLRGAGRQTVTVLGVSPGGGADEALGQAVTVTATSSAPAVIPAPEVSGSGATRSVSFEALPAAFGDVTITVTARDDGGTVNGGVDAHSETFRVSVALDNQAPVAKPGSATTTSDPVALTLEGLDLDDDALLFFVDTDPSHGTLQGDPPNLTYTPEAGFSGIDSFTFSVDDGRARSKPAPFSVTVNGRGRPTRSYFGFGCGCSDTGGGPTGLLLLGVAAWVMRRRQPAGAARGERPRARWVGVLPALALGFGLLATPSARAAEAVAPANAEPGPSVTAAVSPAAPVAPKPRLKLAFLGITAGAGVEKSTASAVSGYLESELGALNAYDVTGPAAIEAVMGAEKQRQILGCDEETATECLSELAGAFNADRSVSGDLSRLGDAILLNLTLIDLKTTKPLARVGRRVLGFFGGVDSVLDVAGPALIELIQQDPVLAGRTFIVERTFGGLLVAVRTEVDLAGRSIAPAVSAELTGRRFGGAVSVLIGPVPGFRGELRYFPVELGRVRPYLGAGATLFAPAFTARGAAGAEVRLGQVHLFADAAYEHVFNAAPTYFPDAVLLSLGAGWLF